MKLQSLCFMGNIKTQNQNTNTTVRHTSKVHRMTTTDTFVYSGELKKDSKYKHGIRKYFDLEEKIQEQKDKLYEMKNRRRLQDIAYKHEEFRKWYEECKAEEEKLKKLQTMKNDVAVQINPNMAFLIQKQYSAGQKKDMLASKPEIKAGPRDTLSKNADETKKRLWFNSPYLIKVKTTIGVYADTLFEPNKENHEKIMNPNTLSYKEMCEQFKIDPKDLRRWVKDGYLNCVELKNLKTGEMDKVALININDKSNQAGLQRIQDLKNIKPKKSQYYMSPKTPIQVLAKLGFASQDELANIVRTGALQTTKAKVTTQDGEEKTIRLINLEYGPNSGGLQHLRNENRYTVDAEGFAKLAKISVSDIENAMLSGEIEIINEYVLKDDENSQYFNLKSLKNRDFLQRKQTEEHIRLETIRKTSSLRQKCVWQLCPNTKNISDKIISQHPEITEVFDKEEKIQDYLKRKEEGALEPDEKEPTMTIKEKIILKSYYKQLWDEAGTQELKEAHKRVTNALSEYKSGGIEAISDIELKEIILKLTGKN